MDALEDADIDFLRIEQDMYARVCRGDYLVVIQVRGVEPLDTLEYSYTIEGVNPAFNSHLCFEAPHTFPQQLARRFFRIMTETESAVELRSRGPDVPIVTRTNGAAREIRVDHELDGMALKAGELITTPQILHAFDESEYPDPLTVDIDRNTGGNSAFGHGIHRCPGSFLAKMEVQILIEEWLKRIPDFGIAPGARIVISPGISSTIRSLPLRWTPQG